jgi:uncharacterized protein involved in outer membrane biogenesis
MRGVRWAALAAALLIVLVGLGAWVLPGLLDWNRYRGELASLASETLGRRVRIAGPVTLSLLPQPMLTASGVTIDQGGSDASVTAAQLRLRVALGALFSGHVDAQELVLHGVDMRLPWPLQPGALALRAPAWLSSLSARIEDGRLTVGGLTLTGIDARLTTAAGSGSSMATGTARLAGQPWRFTMRLSRPGGDGAAGLDVTLDGEGRMQGVGAVLSAQIRADGTLSGHIDGSGPDLSRLLPAPAIAFRAAGRISVAEGLAVADRLDVDLGGSPARGAVALRVTAEPRLDVALTASRLDLDAWLAALMAEGDGGVAGDLPTSIDLSAEAAPFAGGTLRSLRGAFDLAHGAVTVRELRAVLPGDASLHSTGRFTLADPHASPARPARYDGPISIDAPALRTTLGWLQHAGIGVIGQLPPQVFRSARISGHAVIGPGQIALDNISGRIDGSTVGGSLTLQLPAGPPPARPRIGAGLTIDHLDLDPWLPASPLRSGTRPPWLAALDVDLQIDAKQATLHGLRIAPLLLDAAAESGRITLRKLDATADGVHVTVSGTLGEAGRISEARLDLQAPQASRLAAWLPGALAPLAERAQALLHGPLNVSLTAAGLPAAVGLGITASLGDLRLDAQPTVDLRSGDWSGAVTLRHPGAPRLAAALGIPNPGWLGDGSLSLVAQLSRSAGRIAAEHFEVTAGSLRATGALALQNTPQGPSLTGRIAADTLPMPAPRPTDPLPFSALAGWQAAVQLSAAHVLVDQWDVLDKLAATVTLNDGLLRLEGLNARLGGGALSGEASLDATATPPMIGLDATLDGASISGPLAATPLDITAGTLSGIAAVTATGYAPASLLATLSGRAEAHIRHGTFAAIDLARAVVTGPAGVAQITDASLAAALAPGSMPFDTFDIAAQFHDGNADVAQSHLAAPAGTIAFAGNLDLPEAAADLDLTLVPALPDPPAIGLRLNGPLAALRRTPALADLTRWRAAHAR